MKASNAGSAPPIVRVSLPESQLERLRELAGAREVSMSRVVRDALGLALARWEQEGAPPACQPQSPAHGPRALRRAAARGER